MSVTETILAGVLDALHPGDDVLATARERRTEVLDTMGAFPGRLRDYASGSLAHRTAIFDADADCGVVLDRRHYWWLGPDGEGPNAIVEEARSYLREQLKPHHPDIAFRVTKRAIKVSYHEPLQSESDPSVDLIVALTRADAPGLWIPNKERDRWDPSHPECHTDLLTSNPKSLRQKRAQVIRLAKGENSRYDPKTLCSFNLEALALMYVQQENGLGPMLANLFLGGASDLSKRLTPDPAYVSPPIKVRDRELAVRRLQRAGGFVQAALDNDNDECVVRGNLHQVFPDHVEPCQPTDKDMRAALQDGGKGFTVAGGLATGNEQRLRSTRAYGSARFDVQ